MTGIEFLGVSPLLGRVLASQSASREPLKGCQRAALLTQLQAEAAGLRVSVGLDSSACQVISESFRLMNWSQGNP
jgi:hypothetical protein